MRGQYFTGVLQKDGHGTMVIHYVADPTVRQLSAVEDRFAWGSLATFEQRMDLARHLLADSGLPAFLVQEFADDVIAKMASHKMWILAVDMINEWVESHQIAA